MKSTNGLILILTILLLSTSACRNKNLVRPSDPIDQAYAKATRLFEKGKYSQAAEGFEIITRVGRGTDFAKDSQYFLAESYYREGSYLLAASEYERYISFFPNDVRREEVDYKVALSYMQLSPRYKLDQSETIKALESFQLFNNRYPDSELVLESANNIDILRSKLAKKYFMAADFYLRTQTFEAAAIYFGLVIDQFPESDLAEMALIKQIETYVTYADRSVVEKQQERYQKALAGYQKFLQLFPRSESRSDIENLRDRAEKALDELEKNERTALNSDPN